MSAETIPYWLVDSFTSKAFNGNPTPLVIFENRSEYPDVQSMKKISRKFNASETAFVFPIAGKKNEFHIRWYTPSFTEVALCGHATLASAFILFTKYFSLADVPETIILHTRESGLFTTELLQPTATHPLLIQMNVPEKPLPNRYVLERDSSSVAKALDCSASEVVYSGECTSYFGLVEVDSSIDLQNLKIDSTVLCATLEKPVAIVTCRANSQLSAAGFDYNCRVFAAPMGIVEDVATGAAHCVLGPYWGEKLGKVSMRAFQGWGQHVGGCERNSVLYLERKGDSRICINGENKMVGKGELFL